MEPREGEEIENGLGALESRGRPRNGNVEQVRNEDRRGEKRNGFGRECRPVAGRPVEAEKGQVEEFNRGEEASGRQHNECARREARHEAEEGEDLGDEEADHARGDCERERVHYEHRFPLLVNPPWPRRTMPMTDLRASQTIL